MTKRKGLYHNIIITSIGSINSLVKKKFRDIFWGLLIIDEFYTIKTPTSSIIAALATLYRRPNILGLSGTLIKILLADFYSLVYII